MRSRSTLCALAAAMSVVSGIVACAPRDDTEATGGSTAMATATTIDAAMQGAPTQDMKAVLDELAALNPKPIAQSTPAEARRQPTPADAVRKLLEKQGKPASPEPGVTTKDQTIPGAAGNIPVTIYTPQAEQGPFPIVVYFHGGGWVIADRKVYDAGARALSKMANAVVVSVDYRQAPEHEFPAAHDDAFAAYEWAIANASSINGNGRKVALAGESAGGNLAVATALAARDKGIQRPVAVISVYPIAGTDTTTPSYAQHAQAKPLDRPAMSWFFENYLRNEADRRDPRINLVSANLSGLPPTTVINAEIDPLRSEGEMLAQRLSAAGVTTEQRTYGGVTHEFFGMAAVVPKAKEAQQQAADALKKAFQ